MKNTLLIVIVFVLLYFIFKKMAIWINVHMTGWQFIAFIVIVTGIGVYLFDRMKNS